MRIGVLHGDVAGAAVSLGQILDIAHRSEAAGLDTFWMPAIFGHDPLVVLAVTGREVPRIELGSNIVHAYPIHPLALAEQAMTAQVAVGGRLVLGIGTSHQGVIENRWGGIYRPVGFVQEYLDALGPLVKGEAVQTSGKQIRCSGQLRHPDLVPVPLLLAALGPQMLNLAGQRTTGTTTWMTGPSDDENACRPSHHPGVDSLPRDADLVPDLEHPRAHAERLHEVRRRGLLLDEQGVHAARLIPGA